MKKTPDNQTPAAKSRSGLRLVPPPVPETVAAVEPLPPTKPKSSLISFFTAYADAIDRDVQMILDL